MILKPGSVFFVRQQNPLGLGHAVWCARNFISNEPVAVILADDLIDSNPGCMKQMIQNWDGGNMVATMEVTRNETSSYGIIKPGKKEGRKIEVKSIIEKPNIEDAPSQIAVVGRYIILPEVIDHLSLKKRGATGVLQITDSLSIQIN